MNLRLCPLCRRLFPPGVLTCPDHGQVLRDDPLLGVSLGGYQVVSWMAEGVYTAVHPSSEAQTGVRVVSLPAEDSRLSAELLEELRKGSAATEGIGVQPIDGGKLADGRFFYLFPWTRRYRMEPLSASLQRSPRPLVEALEIAADLCAALELAHDAGFYHNGLSGESVLLSYPAGMAPKVQLLDLGLFRLASSGRTRVSMGGLGPGDLADPRNDVYTVGSLLYQLATGTSLQAASAFAGPGAKLPAEFQAVVLRSLAQRKEDRHASIAALRKDLAGLLREARPLRSPSRRRRGKTLPALTALALVLAGGAFFYSYWFHDLPGLPALSGSHSLSLRGTSTIDGAAQKGVQEGLRSPPRTEAPDPTAGAISTLGGEGARRDPEGDELLVPLSARAQALDVLGETLRSPDVEARQCAASLIGFSGDRRLRLQAEELLADLDPRVAGRAAWALGQLGDQAAAVALGQAAQDHQTDLEVGVALLQLGDRRGLDLLRGVLRGKRDSDRLEAALWLGEHNEPEAWRVLRKLLTQAQDQDPLRHLAILGRLCRGRDQAACQQLRDRVAPPDGGGVRGEARLLVGAGLMQAGDGLGYRVLREAAVEPGGRLAALRALSEGDLDAEEERFLIGVVGQPAHKDESHAQSHARAVAAESLGIAGAVVALPGLRGALADPHPAARCAAAGALLRLSALEPRLLLTRASEWAQAGVTEPRISTRMAAVATLGVGPAALAVPLLMQALLDREAEVRMVAAQALGLLQIGSAVPALQQALGDRESTVRVAAVRAVGRIDDPAARALLQDRLDHGTLSEQVVAAGVLLAQGDRSHEFVLRQAMQSPDTSVRRLAMEQARTGADQPQRAALLSLGLSDAADEVQLVAAVGLARMGDRRGVAALRGQGGLLLGQRLLGRDALLRLKENQPTLDVMAALGAAGEGQRAGALQVAKELLPEVGLSLVRRGLRDASPAVRLQAAAAAAELPLGRRAREQLLLQLYHDPDVAVQGRALGLLGRLLQGEQKHLDRADFGVPPRSFGHVQ